MTDQTTPAASVLVDELREQYAQDQADMDRHPTEAGFVAWLALRVQTAEERLRLARQALIARYYTAGEVDDDIAPRIVEMHTALTEQIADARTELAQQIQINAQAETDVDVARGVAAQAVRERDAAQQRSQASLLRADHLAAVLDTLTRTIDPDNLDRLAAAHLNARQVLAQPMETYLDGPYLGDQTATVPGSVPGAPEAEADTTLADRIAQAIGDPGSIAGRRHGPSWGQGEPGYAPECESVTRWATRAVLAVLTETLAVPAQDPPHAPTAPDAGDRIGGAPTETHGSAQAHGGTCTGCGDDIWPGEQATADGQCAICAVKQPATEPRIEILAWDWRGQPDLTALARILHGVGVHLETVDTGSDEIAIALSASPITADQAREAWAWDGLDKAMKPVIAQALTADQAAPTTPKPPRRLRACVDAWPDADFVIDPPPEEYIRVVRVDEPEPDDGWPSHAEIAARADAAALAETEQYGQP